MTRPSRAGSLRAQAARARRASRSTQGLHRVVGTLVVGRQRLVNLLDRALVEPPDGRHDLRLELALQRVTSVMVNAFSQRRPLAARRSAPVSADHVHHRRARPGEAGARVDALGTLVARRQEAQLAPRWPRRRPRRPPVSAPRSRAGEALAHADAAELADALGELAVKRRSGRLAVGARELPASARSPPPARRSAGPSPNASAAVCSSARASTPPRTRAMTTPSGAGTSRSARGRERHHRVAALQLEARRPAQRLLQARRGLRHELQARRQAVRREGRAQGVDPLPLARPRRSAPRS